MNNDELSRVMADLEREIGQERISALRREAARTGTTVTRQLANAVIAYSDLMVAGIKQTILNPAPKGGAK